MIVDSESGWTEAAITINGVPLTFAEAMALRVAVSTFRMTLHAREFRAMLGPVAAGYERHLQRVEQLLTKPEA